MQHSYIFCRALISYDVSNQTRKWWITNLKEILFYHNWNIQEWQVLWSWCRMASPLESLTQICTTCILNTCHPNWQSWSQEFSVRYLTLHSFHSLWAEHMAVIRLLKHKIRNWIIVEWEGPGQEDIIQSQRVAIYDQFKNWVCISEPCLYYAM